MRFPHAALWAGLLLCATNVAAAPAPLPADLTLQTLNASQTLPGAVGVRHANDGSNRLFVIVRTGQIRIMATDGTLQATPFLSFQANTPPLGFTTVSGTGSDERGLLGLAFHPLYATNRKFYVYYLDANSNSVVTEYTASAGNANVADSASARVILRVYQPFTNHNGGDIHFGADGYLYIGLGDGGSGYDPCNSGQSLTSGAMSNGSGCVAETSFTATPPTGVPQGQATSRALLGKMLRIDVDSTNTPADADLCGADPANRRYGIPADNPFAGDSGSNPAACDEIFHYGLRNPYRFSFDRDTHDLIIGDVGQGTFEEVDLVPPAGGHNFGWRVCEGFHETDSTTADCPLAGATDPILAYGRSLGVAITGGFRYRGPYAALQGVYFYADAYGSRIFFARDGIAGWEGATWLNNQGTVVGFGEDEAGHLYLTTLAGLVKRFTLPEGNVEVTKLATFTTDTGQPGVGDVGDVVSYAVTVRNSGAGPVTALVVEDTFGNETPQVLDCAPTTLAANAVATCEVYTREVTQDDVDAGLAFVNVADATAQTAAAGEVTDTASATVAMTPAAPGLLVSIEAQLADTDASGAAGADEEIAYTVTVQNNGNVRLTALAVETTLTGPLACVPTALDPGSVADCGTADYLVTQADVDAQDDIANVASASALAPGGAAVDGSAQALTAVDAPPGTPALLLSSTMTLSDDVDGDGQVDVGDSVTNTYGVENTGNVALDDVAVVSSLHGGVACTPSTLAQGETATCAPATHVATQEDISGSTIVDVAAAHALFDAAPVQSPDVPTELAVDRPDALFADGFESPSAP